MSQDEQQTAICESCKSDLNKEPHKEDCSILANQKALHDAKEAEQEKIIAEEQVKLAKEKADAELEKIKQEKVEKIKTDLKEKQKNEANETRLKNTVIDRLYKLEPRAEEEFTRTKLLSNFSLTELSSFYNQVLSAINEEKNSEFTFIVFCKDCNKKIGKKETEEGAKLFLKQHKLDVHNIQTSKSNWVVVAILTAMLAAGAYAGYKILKKRQIKK